MAAQEASAQNVYPSWGSPSRGQRWDRRVRYIVVADAVVMSGLAE
jgi:hypothetical protein